MWYRFFETLSKTARTAWPVIRRGVREGLSSRALTTVLQKGGIGIRRQTLLRVMTAEKEWIQYGKTLRYIGFDKRADIKRMPIAPHRIRRNFSFTVEIQGLEVETGQPTTRYVTISDDENLPREDIEELGRSAAVRGFERYQLEVESAMWVGAYRRGPAGLM